MSYAYKQFCGTVGFDFSGKKINPKFGQLDPEAEVAEAEVAEATKDTKVAEATKDVAKYAEAKVKEAEAEAKVANLPLPKIWKDFLDAEDKDPTITGDPGPVTCIAGACTEPTYNDAGFPTWSLGKCAAGRRHRITAGCHATPANSDEEDCKPTTKKRKTNVPDYLLDEAEISKYHDQDDPEIARLIREANDAEWARQEDIY